jgi:UDP-N-acetylglucosamine 2-epimerase (non-hydrolysing)
MRGPTLRSLERLQQLNFTLKVAHVEAGLRSFNRNMPEKINRVITDHLSNLLFCSTQTSLDNLSREGITLGIHLVGDVMADALAHNHVVADRTFKILQFLELDRGRYLVLTIHRPNNTDNQKNLKGIMEAVGALAKR